MIKLLKNMRRKEVLMVLLCTVLVAGGGRFCPRASFVGAGLL